MSLTQKWVLISVYNKTGICEFAQALVGMGWSILASGGTAKALLGVGIPVKDVAELVGGGAILKHRVVTLSRELHAGLLADRSDPEQVAEMKKLGLPIIDMVVCDFYPLSDAIAKPEANVESVVELTDIGGPTMVRSAAKGNRIVICRFEDRQPVFDMLKEIGDITPGNREALRARAEFEVARYCMDSARFHSNGEFEGMFGEKVVTLPKGENGYQVPAALYRNADPLGLSLDRFEVLEGSPLSYNNYADIDRLLHTMSHIKCGWSRNFAEEASIAVGVKHGNACGAAIGLPSVEGQEYAVTRTAIGDSRAIFGGLVMCNFPVTAGLALLMTRWKIDGGVGEKAQKFDSVIAPNFEAEAVDIFHRKGGRCRVVKAPAFALEMLPIDSHKKFRPTRNGFLLQYGYSFVLDFSSPEMQVFGERNHRYEKDLLMAWAVGCTSNSNTITIVKDQMLLANGVGQQDRVGAAELAIKRAKDAGHSDRLDGAVAYSDSFFPFPDAPEVLINAGIKAIFSTSGSINDKLTQELCQSRGATLYQLPDNDARGFFGH